MSPKRVHAGWGGATSQAQTTAQGTNAPKHQGPRSRLGCRGQAGFSVAYPGLRPGPQPLSGHPSLSTVTIHPDGAPEVAGGLWPHSLPLRTEPS